MEILGNLLEILGNLMEFHGIFMEILSNRIIVGVLWCGFCVRQGEARGGSCGGLWWFVVGEEAEIVSNIKKYY